MASIGGLDVAFGARMQVVRTNVMCLALADTGLANVTTAPKFILNAYKEALKGTVIEPDFLYIYEIGQVGESGLATTAAIANTLFNQDNSGDGTADVTALEVNGVLRNIKEVPLARNSAFADTTAAHAAFSAAGGYAEHNVYDINGNLALESVLSVSAIALDNTAADADAVDVFSVSEGGSATVTGDQGMFAQRIESLAFKNVYDNAMNASGGNLGSSKNTGLHKGPFTMDLEGALEHLDGAGIATGAAAATVDAYTASTTFATMASNLNGDAGIISVTSLAKVV
tara:strand:- start:170 stop:1024 length:855 start_codon:yes stop_codon:yes gene_type:complete